MSGISGIDQSPLPADIRDGSRSERKAYGAALDFERALVGELTKVMAETAQPADDQSQDAASSTYRDQMPQQLADSLMQSGGLGLARTIYDSLKESGK
jgi:Rod binding domain-containing protein